MAADRLFQKAQRNVLVPLRCEQKVDGLAILIHSIHSAIQLGPLAFDPDIRLVQAPAEPYRPLAAMKGRFQVRAILHNPPVDRRMIDWDSTFLHEVFNMARTQRMGHLPPDTRENDILRDMGTLAEPTMLGVAVGAQVPIGRKLHPERPSGPEP
jgi:hypothetical protein